MSHTLPTYVELRRKVATLTQELAQNDVLLDETIIGLLAIKERVQQLLAHIDANRNVTEVSFEYYKSLRVYL